MDIDQLLGEMRNRLADLRADHDITDAFDRPGLVIRRRDGSTVVGYILHWKPKERPEEVLVDRTGNDGDPNAYLGPSQSGIWCRIDDPDWVERVLRDLLALRLP